jgi:hypothetical protein
MMKKSARLSTLFVILCVSNQKVDFMNDMKFLLRSNDSFNKIQSNEKIIWTNNIKIREQWWHRKPPDGS